MIPADVSEQWVAVRGDLAAESSPLVQPKGSVLGQT
jgi:hypothetical protein